jgi:hypothetical protein
MFGRQMIPYSYGGMGVIGVVRNPSYDHMIECECVYCIDVKRKVIG